MVTAPAQLQHLLVSYIVNEVTFDDSEGQTKTHNIEKPKLTLKKAVMYVVTTDTDGDNIIGQSDIQSIDPDQNKVITDEWLRVGRNCLKTEAAAAIENQKDNQGIEFGPSSLFLLLPGEFNLVIAFWVTSRTKEADC